jgi:hypothetical protein
VIFGVSARRKQAKQDTLRAMQKKETSHMGTPSKTFK